MISQIFAISLNNVIGKENKLPWNLPNDLKYFKSKTINHPIIMGRKTFESFGKPLKNRLNIIVTSNTSYQQPGCIIVHNLDDAVEKAKEVDMEEIFIIGGSSLFSESLSYIDKIYITEIKAEVEGDTFFHFDKKEWREVKREEYHKDSKHAYDYAFVELLRRG